MKGHIWALPVELFYRSPSSPHPWHIHVRGWGSAGCCISHSFCRRNKPPPLCHGENLLGRTWRLQTQTGSYIKWATEDSKVKHYQLYQNNHLLTELPIVQIIKPSLHGHQQKMLVNISFLQGQKDRSRQNLPRLMPYYWCFCLGWIKPETGQTRELIVALPSSSRWWWKLQIRLPK